MPTTSEQQVLELLDQKKGVVEAVAQEMNVSASYVNRIKKRLWTEDRNALTTRQPLTKSSDNLIKALLPPNIEKITELRDQALEALLARIQSGIIEDKDLVRILQVLLKYEATLRDNLAPAAGALGNRNFIQVNLVEQLSTLDESALRALTGMPDPVDLGDIIDGQITEIDNNPDDP